MLPSVTLKRGLKRRRGTKSRDGYFSTLDICDGRNDAFERQRESARVNFVKKENTDPFMEVICPGARSHDVQTFVEGQFWIKKAGKWSWRNREEGLDELLLSEVEKNEMDRDASVSCSLRGA